MARDDLAAMIAVMQGAADGKPVEFRDPSGNGSREWTLCNGPAWNWGDYEYRLKPEPRRIWVNEYEGECFSDIYLTREDADCSAASRRIRCVEFVEVLP